MGESPKQTAAKEPEPEVTGQCFWSLGNPDEHSMLSRQTARSAWPVPNFTGLSPAAVISGPLLFLWFSFSLSELIFSRQLEGNGNKEGNLTRWAALGPYTAPLVSAFSF